VQFYENLRQRYKIYNITGRVSQGRVGNMGNVRNRARHLPRRHLLSGDNNY
jgi:hypothetical protein